MNDQALEIVKLQTKSKIHDYVFKTQDGNKIKPKTIYDNLANPVRKLYREGEVRYGSVHTLRHTFASHLVQRGAGIEKVSKLLGHASLETTMIYADLAPDNLRNAVDVLKPD